jgi:hypothetical protein
MSCAIQSAGSYALSHALSLLPARALQLHTPRHITNHFLLCQRVPHLLDSRRPNSTRASNNNKQDLQLRPENSEATAPSDPWERFPFTTLACACPINTSNDLQDRLDEDGHRVWGFVIYRCTYGDDAAWDECLHRLNLSTRINMHFYEALHLLDDNDGDRDYRFQQTVFQDAAKFDGASTQVVHRHFQEWRALAFDAEQGSNEKIEAPRRREDCGPPFKAGVRYRFCVQIDEEVLQRILSCENPLSAVSDGWVNLIEADWDLETVLAQREEYRIRGIASGAYDSQRRV